MLTYKADSVTRLFLHGIPYSGKLSREKTFTNFVVLWLCAKVIFWCSKSEQSAKVFSAKIVFFTNSRKFSPLKVSRYTVLAKTLTAYSDEGTTEGFAGGVCGLI